MNFQRALTASTLAAGIGVAGLFGVGLAGANADPGCPPNAQCGQHDDHGRGWVWGAGLGRVTVRFETRASGPGPILTLAADDPALHAVGIEPLARALAHGDEQDEALADED